MNKIIRVASCITCDKRLRGFCGIFSFEKLSIAPKQILPNCPLDNEVYDLGPDLEKAVLLMKRLIKSNAREGWEDSEHYNTVLDDANDFLSNFEEINTSEEIGEIELELSLCPIPFCREPRGKEENGSYITPCPHCGDTLPF